LQALRHPRGADANPLGASQKRLYNRAVEV
jgi:hypothetical protein